MSWDRFKMLNTIKRMRYIKVATFTFSVLSKHGLISWADTQIISCEQTSQTVNTLDSEQLVKAVITLVEDTHEIQG